MADLKDAIWVVQLAALMAHEKVFWSADQRAVMTVASMVATTAFAREFLLVAWWVVALVAEWVAVLANSWVAEKVDGMG